MKAITLRFVFLLAACALPLGSFAQTWTYQGLQICFDFGAGVVSCQSQGTITGYLQSQPERQYIGARPSASGEAIGSLIGNLLVAWFNHHQRVKAEQRALRQELLAYIDAHADVAAETLKLDADSLDQLALLKLLDKEHLATWEACEKIVKEQVLLDQRAIALTAEQREVTSDLKLKDRGWAINYRSRVKQLYENSLVLGKGSYVLDQLYRALAGYYQNQIRNGPGVAVPPKKTT